MKKNPRFVVATPGRLNDLLEDNKLLLKGVDRLVIDEADRMLDLGFSPQLKAIQATMRGPRQTLLFAASFGPAVEDVAQIFMREAAVMIRVGEESPVDGLRQRVLHLPAGLKNKQVLEELNAASKGSILVFAGSQESCEKLGRHLKENAPSTEFVHGDMPQKYRSRILRDFREGKFRVLVTTDLLARGLDVSSVSLVINFDLPYKSEDFLHRIGRTARAGRSGNAVTFITPGDARMYRKIAPYLKGAEELKLSPKNPK
jgi:ATP-dependent RNA helicase RhlE